MTEEKLSSLPTLWGTVYSTVPLPSPHPPTLTLSPQSPYQPVVGHPTSLWRGGGGGGWSPTSLNKKFADKYKNRRPQSLIFISFGLVYNTPIHTGVICVKKSRPRTFHA
jgi:hypothetical protein